MAEENTPPSDENDEPREEDTLPSDENDEPREDSSEEDTPPSDENDEPSEDSSEEGGRSSEPAAPSIGANTEIEHVPPEERLAGKDLSMTDAMGREKRRGVIGEAYGPSRSRVILSFVAFFAIVGIVFVGLLVLVNQVDQPPASNPDEAPWSAPDVEQQPPSPLQ